jgi:hypothetical protein
MSEYIDLFKTWPAILAAVLAVLASLFKGAKGLIEFYDDHLRRRHFKRLEFLAEISAGNDELLKLIVSAKGEEVFRSIYGRSCAPEFISGVYSLISSGKFSLAELRISRNYLRLVNGRISVLLGVEGWFLFGYSLFSVVAMGFYVFYLSVSLLKVGTIVAFVAWVCLMLIFVLFSMAFGKDARAVCSAYRVRKKIKALQSSE